MTVLGSVPSANRPQQVGGSLRGKQWGHEEAVSPGSSLGISNLACTPRLHCGDAHPRARWRAGGRMGGTTAVLLAPSRQARPERRHPSGPGHPRPALTPVLMSHQLDNPLSSRTRQKQAGRNSVPTPEFTLPKNSEAHNRTRTRRSQLCHLHLMDWRPRSEAVEQGQLIAALSQSIEDIHLTPYWGRWGHRL